MKILKIVKLTELMNTPVKDTTTTVDDLDSTVVRFKTKKGKIVRLFIDDIGFDRYEVSFTVNGEYNITGKGEELAIFSTVLAGMRQFLDKNPDANLEFTADEQNRIELYDRMIKKYMPAKYVVTSRPETHNSEHTFVITNREDNNVVTELLDNPVDFDYLDNSRDMYTIEFNTTNGQRVEAEIDRVFGNKYILSFDVDGLIKITGGGEAIEIFATVLKFVKETLDDLADDAIIQFTASEASRSKLYYRILSAHIKPPYKFIATKRHNDTLFVFARDHMDIT